MWQYARDPLKYEYDDGTIYYMNKQFAHVFQQQTGGRPAAEGADSDARYEFYHDMVFMMGEMVLAHGTLQNREWLAQEAEDCCMLWNAETREWYNDPAEDTGGIPCPPPEDGPN